MSSAFRSTLPDLLARPEFRALRRARAFLVLDEAMEAVLYANPAGRDMFGLSGGGLPALLLRQIRSGQSRVAQGETVRLVLRVRVGASSLPQAAALSRVEVESGAAILLVAEQALRNAPEDPHRLLADLGLAQAAAALFGRRGLLAAGERFDPGMADRLHAAAEAALADGTSGDRIDLGAATARLLPIDDDMTLALVDRTERPDEADADAPASLEPAPAPAPTPADAEAVSVAARPMNIAAIVGRWHTRLTVPPGADRGERDRGAALADAGADGGTPARPPLLRSFWSQPETPADSPPDDGPVAEGEHEPAVPSDEEPSDPPEKRQPIDGESAVTLPDVHVEDMPALDPALSPDAEKPLEEDLVPGRHDATKQPVELGADEAGAPGPAPAPAATALDGVPVRFVWQIGSDGRFRSLSPEFGQAVGPLAADVVGRSFQEVAEAFGFDEKGEISGLLERRDTWSGRTVLWPVEGTALRVPIDLAALPTYARDRSFDGFRGFGIVRGADFEEDPKAIGLSIPALPHIGEGAPATEAPPAEDPPTPTQKPILKAFESEPPAVSFGRRQQALLPAPEDGEPKVIRFSERRRAAEGVLTASEEAAFREIGVKLGQGAGEATTPGALRFESDRTAIGHEPRAPDGAAGQTAPAEAPFADESVEDDVEDAEPSADIEPFLADLDLPVLVQGKTGLVFANAALLDLAGYGSLNGLNAAGGLDALFAERGGGTSSGRMIVCHADGSSRDMRVRMQRIPFAGRSSLLMSFERQAAGPVAAPAAPAESPELRRELDELKAVLDIATDGVVLIDAEGAIRAVNGSAQALFGYPEGEFRGRPIAGLFAHESQKTVLDYLEMLKDKGLAGVLNDGREVIGRVAQGGFIPLFITVGRLSEDRGWCIVIRDMSHWKRIEEELVNARRAAEAASLHKSRFLANISHELRTPLNAIIGFADVMASECFGPIGNERYIEYLGDIKRSGHHVLDLVNDLLDISKIEAGKMELTFESVSLNEVLAEVVSVMQPQANRERVIVRSNLPASVPPVVADRRTIRQIALNLLSNSVRFTPAGGQIIASTTYTAAGDVLLRVRDSGIGMTERELEIALAPFQQVHRPGTGRGEGTGLGLPLTKAMAEANRASFAIRSTPGEGTLVEIAFSAQRVLAD